MMQKLAFFTFIFSWLMVSFVGAAQALTLAVEVQTGATPQVTLSDVDALAAVRPTPTEVWLVGTGAGLTLPSQGALRQANIQTAEPLQVTGAVEGVGVRLVFNQPHSWQIDTNAVGGFTLARGVDVPPTSSVIRVQDRLEILGDLLQESAAPQKFQVQSPSTGVRLTVLPLKTKIPDLGMATLWGLAVPADVNLRAEAGKNFAFEWEKNPTLAPTPTLVSQELREDVEVLLEQIVQAAPPVFAAEVADVNVLRWLPTPIKAEEFTPLFATKDPAQVARALQFSQAAGAIQQAVRQVNVLNPPPIVPDTFIEDAPLNAVEETARVLPVQAETATAIQRTDAFLLAQEAIPEGVYFRDLEAAALAKIAQYNVNTASYDGAVMDLARLYLNFERPRQAAQTLRNVVSDEAGIPVAILPRTLLATTLILDNQPAEGLALLDEGLEPHRTVWAGVAQVQLGNFEAAADAFGENVAGLRTYPANVLSAIYEAEAQLLLSQQKYTALQDYIETIAAGETEVSRTLNYIMGLAHLELGNTDQGRALLSDVAEKVQNTLGVDGLATQAKLDFITDLSRTGDLGIEQEILFLEDLQYEWRGDAVEGKILKRLGELYAGTKQFRRALDRWKTYAVNFPDGADVEDVTANMRDTFVAVFDPKNRHLLDNLGLLSMYYDFRELTPADARGDEVVELVAQELDGSVLYRRATDLFENQLSFRVTDPIQQVGLATELAALYRKAQDPNLAHATLEAYPVTDETPYVVARAWNLEQARVHLDLGDLNIASQFAANYIDESAQNLQIDIAWAQQNFSRIANVLAQRYDTDEHAGFTDVRTRTDFIRLAYALVQLGQKPALTQLISNYKTEMRNYPEVADIVNVYATEVDIDEDTLPLLNNRPLQRIAKQLLELNDFEASYASNKQGRIDRDNERRDFNEKIRFRNLAQDLL